jgi:hypothetical protein
MLYNIFVCFVVCLIMCHTKLIIFELFYNECELRKSIQTIKIKNIKTTILWLGPHKYHKMK